VQTPQIINFGYHIAKSRVANQTILSRAKAKVHAALKQGRGWEIFFNKSGGIYDILVEIRFVTVRGGMQMNLVIFWAVLFVVFVVVELATAGLTSIWFALGAAGALISAAIAPMPQLLWLQVVIFLLISGVTMYFTRPLARKYAKVKETHTNADRVLAMIGVVREPICNLEGRGVVYVGGKLWTARSSQDEERIEKDAQVDILRIEGVKLIVRPHVAEAVEEAGVPVSPE